MGKLTDSWTGLKKCDLAALTGAAVFTICALLNVIRFAALGIAPAFMAMSAASIAFWIASVFAWRSRLPFVWLLIGAGSFIAYSCSNVPGYMANPVFPAQTVFAVTTGICAFVFKVKEKQKYRPLAYRPLTALVLFCAVTGAAWGFKVSLVRGKDTSAQNEIWAVPRKYDGEPCPEKGAVEKVSYETKAYATDGRRVAKHAYVYKPYGYTEENQYDILYLLHGSDDDESYWFARNEYNKTMVDNLIYYGDIKPLIIVMPSWYTGDDYRSDPDVLTKNYS
jgi:hypothetical protein